MAKRDVNVTAYVNQLGYGVAGLNVVKALFRRGVRVALWVNGQGQAPEEDRPLLQYADANRAFFDPDAPSLRVAHQFDFAHRVGRGPHAGMTFYELDRLTPSEVHHLSSLDLLFVPSAWAAGVAARSGVPADRVRVAPLGADPAVFHHRVRPACPSVPVLERLASSRACVFLNCGKWEVRKGHDVLCRAFARAFGPGDEVLLVMNCSSPFLKKTEQDEWVRTYLALNEGKRAVFVLPERLSRQQDVAGLMALADCGVFPARAEGWNLELGEMMAMGKHVIATDHAGHTEYCTAENCRLVGVADLEDAYDGTPFFTGQGRWAELGDAQVSQLADHMRAVYEAKRAGKLGRNEAGARTMASLTWDLTAGRVLEAFGG